MVPPIVGWLASRVDKTSWRSGFIAFCFGASAQPGRKSLSSQAFGFVGAAGAPFLATLLALLSLAVRDSVGKTRAIRVSETTKWGLVLFHIDGKAVSC
jgi:hypothetical protein